MDCDKTQDLFQLYIENKLEPGLKEEIEKHLKQCNNCSQFLKEFRNTVDIISSVKKEELPEDYYQKLMLKLDGAQKALQKDDKNIFYKFKPNSLIPALAIILIAVCIWNYISLKPKTNISPKESPAKQQEVTENIEQKQPSITVLTPKETVQETSEQKQISEPTEIKKTIEIAKNEDKDKFIFRGAGAKYIVKKIIKQWQDIASGIKTKQTLIIKNHKEWEKIWKLHSDNPEKIPEIDFNKSYIIAVFMGEQKTTGYGIQIKQIEESEDNIYIDTIETVPSKGTVIAEQSTQPFHIVVVNKE